MRDPDAMMEHEAKQQRLVEGILDTLHRKTRNTSDYRRHFLELGKILLEQIEKWIYHNRPIRADVNSPEWHMARYDICEPIIGFTQSKAEREYLLMKVFERVMDSVSSGIVGAYQAEELKRNYAAPS